jgi:hypothetical protein
MYVAAVAFKLVLSLGWEISYLQTTALLEIRIQVNLGQKVKA